MEPETIAVLVMTAIIGIVLTRMAIKSSKAPDPSTEVEAAPPEVPEIDEPGNKVEDREPKPVAEARHFSYKRRHKAQL